LCRIGERWKNAQRAAEEKAARATEAAWLRGLAEVGSLHALTDDELIASAPAKTSLSTPAHEMEIERRLKDAIETLTGEIVVFHEAADRAAEKSEKADVRLERLTRWLIGLTVVLVALTAAVVALTIVLG
jgi:hypothetical protein